MLARLTSGSNYRQEAQTQALESGDTLFLHDANIDYLAEADERSIVRFFKKCTKRQFCPPWGVPSEIWLMILRTHHFRIKSLNEGLGAEKLDTLAAHIAHSKLNQFLVHVRRAATTPVSWHRAASSR